MSNARPPDSSRQHRKIMTLASLETNPRSTRSTSSPQLVDSHGGSFSVDTRLMDIPKERLRLLVRIMMQSGVDTMERPCRCRRLSMVLLCW
eukprot:scaffold89188_cov53-Attheya_sp.AAC.3